MTKNKTQTKKSQTQDKKGIPSCVIREKRDRFIDKFIIIIEDRILHIEGDLVIQASNSRGYADGVKRQLDYIAEQIINQKEGYAYHIIPVYTDPRDVPPLAIRRPSP